MLYFGQKWILAVKCKNFVVHMLLWRIIAVPLSFLSAITFYWNDFIIFKACLHGIFPSTRGSSKGIRIVMVRGMRRKTSRSWRIEIVPHCAPSCRPTPTVVEVVWSPWWHLRGEVVVPRFIARKNGVKKFLSIVSTFLKDFLGTVNRLQLVSMCSTHLVVAQFCGRYLSIFLEHVEQDPSIFA